MATYRTYLIANSSGWLLAAILTWIGVQDFGVPAWIGTLLVGLLILKDLLLYPAMRRYYRPQSSEGRMLGARGTALTSIGPRGFVRVRGEIWQAEIVQGMEPGIREGTGVRVRGIRGLLLFVEPD